MTTEEQLRHMCQAHTQAIRERDEAREAARKLFAIFRSELEIPSWLEAYPCLEEGACGREAGAGE